MKEGNQSVESPEELRNRIELLRKELIQVGQQDGLNSMKAISLSQELDEYIVKCQKSCSTEKG